MSLFQRVVEGLEENKLLREQGKDIAIPFPFKRFAEYVPGIQKGRYVLVTANSKVGKSKITDYLFVYNVINFAIQNKTNIKPKIFYFSLEISKEDKMKEAIAYKLFMDDGIILSTDRMDSLFRDYILESDKLDLIKKHKDYFDKYQSIVTYIDNIRNPYGIYKYIREYAESNGVYYDKSNNIVPMGLIKSNDERALLSIDRYEPNDPDEFVIVVVDNYNILTPEHGQSLHDAISNFSNNYALRIRDRWKYIIVAVQQQAAAQESVENLKLDRLQPSANGLGDCKLVGRDVDLMLGLFAPSRYKIREYEGYDITKLRDNHRELSVILNRRGGATTTQLGFNGASCYFNELPKSNEMTPDEYQEIMKKYRTST